MTGSTKLKVAAEEIKDILRKHDIAGAVALHTEGNGEYFFHLSPSYSCAYIYNEAEVRFHSKLADYPSKEEQARKQTATSNMLSILKDISIMTTGVFINMSETFDKLTGSKHTTGNWKHGK